MTSPLETTTPTAPVARDDRTRRALELVVGAERADVSLTHFAASRVEVCVGARSLETANGMLATTAMLNMLGRFVGTVELRVVGTTTSAVDAALDDTFERLRRIDTRVGRSVRRVDAGVAGEGEVGGRIWIGDVRSAPAGGSSCEAEMDVHVAFDAWTCALRRGAAAGAVVAATVPFGALIAACFAVAEVFKTLVASSVPESEVESFRRRFVHDWHFSAWTMERFGQGISVTPRTAPEVLPPLAVDGVLQVGAGAVGNATALAFASAAAVVGELAVLDLKCVDVKNLNRCFFFTEDDIDAPKVEALERAAARPDWRVRGRHQLFDAAAADGRSIILSTVDNNEVRHRMQEALPDVLIEGATGGTTVAVGVHTPGNGRSCLVCRHPDPEIGVTRRVPLSLADAAAATGLTEAELASGRVGGETVITDEVIERVAARSADAAAALKRAREDGQDLCGALGDLRAQLGTVRGPREASIPFVSNLAGVLAAAEVIKLLLRAGGVPDVPVLDNVLEIDLARNYGRHARLAFLEPPRSDCAVCQERADHVAQVYGNRQRAARPYAADCAPRN